MPPQACAVPSRRDPCTGRTTPGAPVWPDSASGQGLKGLLHQQPPSITPFRCDSLLFYRLACARLPLTAISSFPQTCKNHPSHHLFSLRDGFDTHFLRHASFRRTNSAPPNSCNSLASGLGSVAKDMAEMPPQRGQTTSVRVMKKLRSSASGHSPAPPGVEAQPAGPDSYLLSELNKSGRSQRGR
jgi:hypothetical protein